MLANHFFHRAKYDPNNARAANKDCEQVHLSVWHSLGLNTPTWEVAAVLFVLLITGASALTLLWPRSRAWTKSNRLHTSATRSQRAIRADGLRLLDRALRDLTNAATDDRSSQAAVSSEFTILIREVQLIRSQILTDYIPSPANLRGSRDAGTEWLSACELLEDQCRRMLESAIAGDLNIEERMEIQHTLRVVRKLILEPL